MKPAPFDYVRPESIAETIETLRQADGEAKIIAGGQSLVPVLAMRLARPSVLVDINRIPGIDGIVRTETTMLLGALVRHHELTAQTSSPLLAEAARWIGHAAIRARGTLGGSIAHADPAAELPTVAAALEASIETAAPNGGRTIPAASLFDGPLQTVLEPDEMIIRVAMPLPQRWGFAELARRQGDFGLVTVVTVYIDDQWRVALGGVGPVPLRPTECEAILNEGTLNTQRIELAATAAATTVGPITDLHATAQYRTAMIAEYTRRALYMATKPNHTQRAAPR